MNVYRIRPIKYLICVMNVDHIRTENSLVCFSGVFGNLYYKLRKTNKMERLA